MLACCRRIILLLSVQSRDQKRFYIGCIISFLGFCVILQHTFNLYFLQAMQYTIQHPLTENKNQYNPLMTFNVVRIEPLQMKYYGPRFAYHMELVCMYNIFIQIYRNRETKLQVLILHYDYSPCNLDWSHTQKM